MEQTSELNLAHQGERWMWKWKGSFYNTFMATLAFSSVLKIWPKSSRLLTSAIHLINSPKFDGSDEKTTERTFWMSFTPSDFKRRGTSSIMYFAILTQLSCLQLWKKIQNEIHYLMQYNLVKISDICKP